MALSFPWIYPVRFAQFIFGIIVLGLTAYVVSLWWASGSTVNFMLFNGVWTPFVAVPFLVLAPTYFPNLAHRLILVGVELVTMIFWFAGFIALAVALPAASYCHGSACSCLQAATVFGAFEWVLFAITSATAVMGVMRSGPSGKTANVGV
ncbi:MARVEL domain-containing protein [Aspergillus glaucus CBS 516.65]|uniref:MARVEL domain-containing protein n=1 Tax=Aspergillus glaucus CBS 516.65 TaxID=1160497 RepID=A0A1L9V6X3_ASPGL|nr:hypothetical protein ASPGLDRAFT_136466 [Aspergillus glaucus CBS 516.65]OJJ79656.1 hypothetical protein ASPGLDRAFT_136466 [Aspergillus glaucus CBS 516.65]